MVRKLKKTLEELGIERLASSECVFKIKGETVQVVILAYAEDLLVLGSMEEAVSWFKDKLWYLFNKTELTDIKDYLRVTFERKGNVMTLHQ